jgi:peptide-methionine (S)-S-oxide reductase
VVPGVARDEEERMKREKAIFAAGCFWGVEAAFQQVPGVASVRSGYTGGTTARPTYEQVCSDRTGHAEAVEVEFDPEAIPYEKLLEVFWQIHDPTQLNRQGPDFGSQYRTAIFTTTPEQEAEARRSLANAQASFPRPIVTEITSAKEFWEAEEYHQRYFEKHGIAGCHVQL